MLVSLVGELEAVRGGEIPATHGDLLQGAIFKALKELDEGAASRLHGTAEGSPRPYTISQVSGVEAVDGVLRLEPGQGCWFRITGLTAEASLALLALSERLHGWTLYSSRGRVPFQVRQWRTEGHPWAALLSGEDLARRAMESYRASPQRIVLEFRTPVCFELDGKKGWGSWMPFPLPELVFGSLRHRITSYRQEFGQPPSREDLASALAVGRVELSSRMLHFERHNRRRSGVVGLCEYLIDREAGRETATWLHLLAQFSFFSGVGAAVSWGMGQCGVPALTTEPARTWPAGAETHP